MKHIYRTFGSVSITGPITGDIIQALGKDGVGVKSISHNGAPAPQSTLSPTMTPIDPNDDWLLTCTFTGAGYDQIDTAACTTAGISISNTPTAVNASTADTSLFLLLSALRGFNAPMQALRSGKWRGAPPPPLGHDPEGKVLGILGMGGIGKDLARRAMGLGMRVVYHNRRRLEEEEERGVGGNLGEGGGVRYVGWEELLGESDVLSVNLPLNVRALLCDLLLH